MLSGVDTLSSYLSLVGVSWVARLRAEVVALRSSQPVANRSPRRNDASDSPQRFFSLPKPICSEGERGATRCG